LNILDLENASVVLGETRVLDSLTAVDRRRRAHRHSSDPNGAGKSTLMKLLTLQLYPVAASNGVPPIRVFGQERWNVFELRSQLGIISPDLHDRLVNGQRAGRISRATQCCRDTSPARDCSPTIASPTRCAASASAALELMGVAHLADATLDRVSTGEAPPSVDCRARSVHEPKRSSSTNRPAGSISVARPEFMERVRDIARHGVTILLVTHHVEEIIPEIDRVILLRRGRVAFDGPKRSVLTAPRLAMSSGHA
jgi:iron complex transport system ATP-binding protein